MGKDNKSSIRRRILASMVVFVALIAVSGIVAIVSIQYLGQYIDEASALVDVQKTVFTYFLVFVVIIAAAILYLIYSIFNFNARIQHPLSALNDVAYHLTGTGNLRIPEEMSADLEYHSKSGDEIGRVITSFIALMANLLEKVEVLQAVARGDLRHKVKPASDEDYLGLAVNDVVRNLNSIVSDVITATEQLSVGANELSTGAQSLSQSASEQSLTMDQLHATAGEIAAEAAENAERAAEASILTDKIRVNASEGSRKMVDMTMAMNEINKASHAIRSVMKAIDEIAFQTNILALNAAVEAARAGSHGKGFAVVADEVRNLATKSGGAANDSNALIADTISKSDMGTKIVDEAIAFFKTIEEGIANTSELLNEIAKAARNQSMAIEHINISLTDMTNVVYHNSATSEQSAAASEQMSSQANLLKEAINRFLLEGDTRDAKTVLEIAEKTELYKMQAPSPEPEPSPAALPDQPRDFPAFAAPPSGNDAPAFNPTTAPSENGGRSPAELYAEALRREESEDTFSMRRKEPEAKGGFRDDESKY